MSKFAHNMQVPAENHNRVQKVSSILLNSPAMHEVEAIIDINISKKQTVLQHKKVVERDNEIIPGIEEAQIHPYASSNRKHVIIDPNIIEISSEEEDTSSNQDPFSVKVPGACPTNESDLSQPEKAWFPQRPKALSRSEPRRYNRARRIIQSSSSDDSDNEGLVGTIRSFSERSTMHKTPPKTSGETIVTTAKIQDAQVYIAAELDDIWDHENAILTLNEPKGSKKPIHRTPSRPEKSSTYPSFRVVTPVPDEEITVTPADTPLIARPIEGVQATPKSITSIKKPRQLRSDKKAKASAEQAKREAYAQNLFTELNQVVFKDGLPKETKLNWNKRLLTTAGRAKWHRSRDGTQTTEIELAEKILDCEERIRNTLSHEMCHLASWVIDGDPKEVHGRLWKGWAIRVMRKRPDIEITTRHDYEISYPYEWECEKCAKVYGRFSKSIRTDECVCGSCKVGKLLPRFPAPPRVPKAPKTSRNAASRSRDSPRSVPQTPFALLRGFGEGSITPSSRGPREVYIIHDSDSEPDSDVDELTTAMRSVTLVAAKA